jgi:hypothetical protein
VFGGQRACGFDKCLGRGCNAALTLHRLHHHGTGLVGNGGFQRGDIVIRQVRDAFRLGAEAIGIFRLAAHGHGKESPAMEGIGKGNDLDLFRAEFLDGVTTRQLECSFVGLGAGIGKKHLLGKGGIHQLACQTQSRLVGQHIAQVPDLVGLFGQRLDQCRMRVANTAHGNAAGQVDVFLALLIPHARASATHRHKTGGGVIGYHHPVEIGSSHMGIHCRLSLSQKMAKARLVATPR